MSKEVITRNLRLSKAAVDIAEAMAKRENRSFNNMVECILERATRPENVSNTEVDRLRKMLGKICSADQNGAIVCGRFRSFTVTDEGKIFACVGWDNATGSDRKFDLSETKIDML